MPLERKRRPAARRHRPLGRPPHGGGTNFAVPCADVLDGDRLPFRTRFRPLFLVAAPTQDFLHLSAVYGIDDHLHPAARGIGLQRFVQSLLIDPVGAPNLAPILFDAPEGFFHRVSPLFVSVDYDFFGDELSVTLRRTSPLGERTIVWARRFWAQQASVSSEQRSFSLPLETVFKAEAGKPMWT